MVAYNRWRPGVTGVWGIAVGMCLLIPALFPSCTQARTSAAAQTNLFRHVVVDADGPREPWGKAFGDVNGDGRVDLLVGGNGGGLAWYENPSWRRHVIASAGHFSTDLEVVDVDRDGRNDVIALMTDRLVWFRGPRWDQKTIDDATLHDIEVADLDGDGRVDVVARGQAAFGGGGDVIYLYHQANGGWERRTIPAPPGEGLKISDVDGDGHPDIVINVVWYRNPGHARGDWNAHRYTRQWNWPHTYVDTADIDGDGRIDIVLAPSESAGERYRISWFAAPADRTGEWREHVVDVDVEAVQHFVAAADMNNDGRVDIVAAQMHQGKDPDEVRVYFNRADGGWSKHVVSTEGSHNMRVVDIDGDGDLDLFGANWSGPRQAVELWVNQTCPPKLEHTQWRRHVIDATRPWRAVFVSSADIDGDGRRDVVTGGWWYRNPGSPGGAWQRQAIGAGAHNMALLLDADGDGDIDVLATRGKGAEPDARFVWAENDGKGRFTVHANIPAGEGDFLQGVAAGRFTRLDRRQVALSWHAPGKGVQLLTLPERPARTPWTWERISASSQDEALSAGDIDGDGRLDLLLGTRWLRNERDGWRPLVLARESADPDRNRLADINGDGRLDAVVGFEAISRPGDVVWYAQGRATDQAWTRHRIATVTGPMSLDVADMDGDGDFDVVVGEHNLEQPAAARLLLFENADGHGGRWREHMLHRGDEHHDGAVVVDIDGDGDLDIVSIGWGHDRVLLYENMAPLCVRR